MSTRLTNKGSGGPSKAAHGGENLGCERIDVSVDGPANETELEHRVRYEWALGQAISPLLDAACGTGHGSALLAGAHDVTGVDQSADAIARARSRAMGTFVVASAPPLPFETDSFASIVSFETIEHIDDDRGFVRELRRVLKPGGPLMMSTPNKRLTSPDGEPPNHWHVREYYLEQLMELLRIDGAFEDFEIFAQRHVPRSGLVRWLALNARLRLGLGRPGGALSRAAFGDLGVQRWDGTSAPLFWVVLAR